MRKIKKPEKLEKQTRAGKRLIQAAKEMVAHYKGEIDLPDRRQCRIVLVWKLFVLGFMLRGSLNF